MPLLIFLCCCKLERSTSSKSWLDMYIVCSWFRRLPWWQHLALLDLSQRYCWISLQLHEWNSLSGHKEKNNIAILHYWSSLYSFVCMQRLLGEREREIDVWTCPLMHILFLFLYMHIFYISFATLCFSKDGEKRRHAILLTWHFHAKYMVSRLFLGSLVNMNIWSYTCMLFRKSSFSIDQPLRE